jgi:hypothetical protein
MNSYLASKVRDHAWAPVGRVTAGHKVTVRSDMEPDNLLRTILTSAPQVPTTPPPPAVPSCCSTFDLNLSNYHNNNGDFIRQSDTGTLLVAPSVSFATKRENEKHFDHTFTGADLLPFIDEMPQHIGSFGYFTDPGYDYLDMWGEHTAGGLVIPAVEAILSPAEVQAGTGSGKSVSKGSIAGASLAVARLVNLAVNEATGHHIAYSDMHTFARMEADMSVTYTYEPHAVAIAVPEPSSLVLFGFGLAGLCALRRHKSPRKGVAKP